MKVHIHLGFEAVQKLSGSWCEEEDNKPDAKVLNERTNEQLPRTVISNLFRLVAHKLITEILRHPS